MKPVKMRGFTCFTCDETLSVDDDEGKVCPVCNDGTFCDACFSDHIEECAEGEQPNYMQLIDVWVCTECDTAYDEEEDAKRCCK